MEIDQATLRKIEANNELARLGFGSDDDVSRAPKVIAIPKQYQTQHRKNLTKENIITNNLSAQQEVKQPETIIPEPPPQPTILVQPQPPQPQPITQPISTQLAEPKIYSVNGSRIKVMPDGKIFTEQWVEITPESEDYAKIRILAEKTKKPISLSGKIIQMLKWVEAKEPNE